MSQWFQHIKTILKQPKILKPYKRILLLSHMRANTSLLGHILGSNPEIEGYYELHIGYYSWKSFIRQKLIYFADHSLGERTTYLFDKVLDSGHFVNTQLFQKDEDKIIIMVREPKASIASIMKLYSNNGINGEYATLEGATKYYEQRLRHLIEYANDFEGKFIFLKAEDLIENSDVLLSNLSQYLQLKEPLTKEYKSFKKTGAKYAGDSSENISKGKIQKKSHTDQEIDLPESIMSLYQEALNTFLKKRNLQRG